MFSFRDKVDLTCSIASGVVSSGSCGWAGGRATTRQPIKIISVNIRPTALVYLKVAITYCKHKDKILKHPALNIQTTDETEKKERDTSNLEG